MPLPLLHEARGVGAADVRPARLSLRAPTMTRTLSSTSIDLGRRRALVLVGVLRRDERDGQHAGDGVGDEVRVDGGDVDAAVAGDLRQAVRSLFRPGSARSGSRRSS